MHSAFKRQQEDDSLETSGILSIKKTVKNLENSYAVLV